LQRQNKKAILKNKVEFLAKSSDEFWFIADKYYFCSPNFQGNI